MSKSDDNQPACNASCVADRARAVSCELPRDHAGLHAGGWLAGLAVYWDDPQHVCTRADLVAEYDAIRSSMWTGLSASEREATASTRATRVRNILRALYHPTLAREPDGPLVGAGPFAGLMAAGADALDPNGEPVALFVEPPPSAADRRAAVIPEGLTAGADEWLPRPWVLTPPERRDLLALVNDEEYELYALIATPMQEASRWSFTWVDNQGRSGNGRKDPSNNGERQPWYADLERALAAGRRHLMRYNAGRLQRHHADGSIAIVRNENIDWLDGFPMKVEALER